MLESSKPEPAQCHNQGGQVMEEYCKYVRLDVHKRTIVPAVADAGRSKPKLLGVTPNTKHSIEKLIRELTSDAAKV